MKNIDELGQVITTDVLVIGGGISGLLAAVKAKEKPVDVLVVDKGGIGWAGQVPVTGGGCMFLRPGEEEKWFEWAVPTGGYLNNQDWAHALANGNRKSVIEAAELGLPFLRTDDGQVRHVPIYKYSTSTRYLPGKFMIKLKQAAVKKAVRTLDKIYIVDLLRQDSRVVGAIGFGLVDGKTYIIKAKATVIANGGCMFQGHRQFTVNSGEAIAMAYRVGAQLMNAEFSTNYSHGFKGDIFTRQPVYLYYENALGEKFMGKYFPELMSGLDGGQELENFNLVVVSMVKELEAGRGPIYLDWKKILSDERDAAEDIALRRTKTIGDYIFAAGGDFRKVLRERCGLDVEKEKIEVRVKLHGSLGTIRVGLDCDTTVDGLWAVGDACVVGSGLTGAAVPGSYANWGAIPFAIVSGLKGGRSAGEYAATCGEVQVEYEEVKKLKEGLLTPLGRHSTMMAHEALSRIQEVMVPVKYHLHREAGRLNEALKKIDTAKQNTASAGAEDYHELMQYHRAESMALCASFILKAALMREESRGTHWREDYPNKDDENWLKWIIIREEAGEAKFFTEPVPFERYRLKPSVA